MLSVANKSFMPSVIILSVIKLSVIVPSVLNKSFMLSVIMPSVANKSFMPNVIMLSVVKLNVVAPTDPKLLILARYLCKFQSQTTDFVKHKAKKMNLCKH
jgi:hypothetical protein